MSKKIFTLTMVITYILLFLAALCGGGFIITGLYDLGIGFIIFLLLAIISGSIIMITGFRENTNKEK